MDVKNVFHHRCTKHKRILALIIALTTLCSMLPARVFALASDSPSEYLCNHIHDENCGYVDGSADNLCSHIHDGNCGYVDGSTESSCPRLGEAPIFPDCIPDEAIDVYNTDAKETYDEISTECTGEAGIGSNCEELTNEQCANMAENVDGEELPLITDTVTETAIILESAPLYSIDTITDDTNTVSVTGLIPEDARLEVRPLTEEELASYVAVGINVVFAYDIKIITGGEFDEASSKYVGGEEFQPGADHPVVVTIIPTEPVMLQAEVTVVHIAEDETTGETASQAVANVSTTENGAVAFSAEGFSIYIGTVLSGTTLTLASGSGYRFYDNATCNSENEISGFIELTTSAVVYVKANENYTIREVTVAGVGGDSSSAGITKGNPATDIFDYSFTFSTEIVNGSINQLITVATTVNAPGGTIAGNTIPSDVTRMFDATATANNTDNVNVTNSGSSFTVTLKNDITLNGMITIGSGVTLTILSSGSHTITRGETCETNMFYSNGGHLVLGSGDISTNTITYHFNNGYADETYDIGVAIPTSTDSKYVTYTTVNANVNSTMKGALIIDGGAVLPEYTGTEYSFSNPTIHSENRNLIRSIGGSVTMWSGITLQNNLFSGNDTQGGGAVNLNNSTMYMYGGVIRRCVNRCSNGTNSSSFGDGGAMFLQGDSSNIYMYSGTITECESDNSGAISLWRNASLYLMGGTIHRNYAVGDMEPLDPLEPYYPPQAISAYDSASMYIYGGTISDNQGENIIADVRVSSKGANTLHLFGGTINKIVANSNIDNKIYIYAGQVGSITNAGDAQLIRFVDEPKTVRLLNAVSSNGTQTVHVNVYSGDILIESFNTTGTGTGSTPDSSLVMQLHKGTHTVTVTSVSMVKTYTVIVTDDSPSDLLVSAASRIMTKPFLSNVTTNSVSLSVAGTGNSTDGIIKYGYSTTGNSADVSSWQTGSSFINLSAGTYYFFVKAEISDYLAESICEQPLPVTLAETVTLSLGENILLAPGGVYIIHPIITPEDHSLDELVWSIKGATSPDTRVIKNNDGSGSVTISVHENTNNIIEIHAALSNSTASAKVAVVVGTTPSASMVNATVEAGKSVSWSMDGYSYRWQKFNGSTWENIEGQTMNHYTPSLEEVGDKIRLVMTGGEPEISFYSATVTVIMNTPTFTVTIPETISMVTTSFTIIGNISGLLPTQSPTQNIEVTVTPSDGDTGFELVGTNNEGSLQYGLHPGSMAANAVGSGGTVACFNTNGNEQSENVYYDIIDYPIFSGTYTDTLTFTVKFNNGS